MDSSCPICGVAAKRTRDRVRGDVPIAVYRCEECLLEFLETWDDVARAASFYRSGQYVFRPGVTGGPLKFNEYDARVARVRPYLTPETRLLEIGCGEGSFLTRVRSLVARAEGVEISEAHLMRLRAQGFAVWDRPISELGSSGPYDVVCMFALLEHVPRVRQFLEDLRAILHPRSQVFLEVPDLLDPLASYYDVPEYGEFYYREYHLYYFTEHSLRVLLARAGFEGEFQHLVQASLTNHFHWMHQRKPQANTNEMVNVTLPAGLRSERTPKGVTFSELLDEVDDFYRRRLTEAGIGDLLACRAWLKGSA